MLKVRNSNFFDDFCSTKLNREITPENYQFPLNKGLEVTSTVPLIFKDWIAEKNAEQWRRMKMTYIFKPVYGRWVFYLQLVRLRPLPLLLTCSLLQKQVIKFIAAHFLILILSNFTFFSRIVKGQRGCKRNSKWFSISFTTIPFEPLPSL